MRISKKILAIALSILMAVSMMPFTVFAATANLSDVLASATGKYVEITDTDIVVDADTTLTGHILDLYGNTTIDLNGHNLVAGATNSGGQEVAIWINPNANVTITDSAQPSSAASYSTTTGDLTIKDGVAAISSTYYGIINEGNLTLGKVVVKGDDNAICVAEGGSLTTTETNSIICGGTYGVTYPGGNATLNLTKGMIYGQYGLSGNSSWDSANNKYKFGGNTINIGTAKIYGKGVDDENNGVINGAAIVLGADDDCNITGSATIYGYDAPAIVVRASADLDITGSPTVKTYGTVTNVKVLDGNTSVPSAPVAVDTACGYTKADAIDVDIAGGTYEATVTGVTNAVALVGNSGDETAEFVEVTGGTYSTKAGADDVSDLIVNDPTTPDVHKVLDGSGKVVNALVEMDGNYYANATMAMKDVPADNTQHTIKLLDDVSISGLGGVKVLANQNVVFDLNGKTWLLRGAVGSTGTVTNGFQFLKGSTVKIKDGTITAKLASIYTVIQNYGDLTIENATIAYTGSGVNRTTVSTNSSNVTIKNSTIIGATSSLADPNNSAINVNPGWGAYVNDTAAIVIEDTTITGDVKVEATSATSTADVEFTGTTSFDTRGEIVMSDASNGTTDVKNTGTGVEAPADYKWVDNGYGTSSLTPIAYGTAVNCSDAEATITGNATSHTVITLDGATLNFASADPTVGRYYDGYYFTVKFVAPNGENIISAARYTNGSVDSETGQIKVKNLYNAKDGANFMYSWPYVTVESTEAAIEAGVNKEWNYTFDWDGDGIFEQAIDIVIVPGTVKLVKDGKQVYPAGAEINGVRYATLEDAWNAAQDGDTIKLLNDCNGNGLIAPQGKFGTNGLTVDLNGYTYSVTGTPVGSTGTETIGFQLLKNNKITFKNGTLAGDTYANRKLQRMIQNYSDLTLDKVEVYLKGAYYNQTTMSNCNGSTQIINGSTVNAPDYTWANYDTAEAAESLGAQAMAVGTFQGYTDVSVNVEDSTINGNVSVGISNPTTTNSNELTFGDGAAVNGKIAMKDNAAEKATVAKDNNATVATPAGFEWDENNILQPIADVFNLSIEDSINMNMYINTEAYADDATIEVTYSTPELNDKTAKTTDTISASTLPKDSQNRVKLTVNAAPAQITDEVVINVKSGNQVVHTVTTSVKAYCEEIIAQSNDTELVELAKTMLDYGKAANTAFQYTEASRFNYNNGEDYYDYFNGPVDDIAVFDKTGNNGDFAYYSYIATTVPALRLYTNLSESQCGNADGVVTKATITNVTKGTTTQVAPVVVDLGNDNTAVAIDITGILAEDLADVYTVEYMGSTITLNAIQFAKAVKDTDRADFGRAMFNYYVAADAYFNN